VKCLVNVAAVSEHYRIANGSEVELNLVRLLLEDTALGRSDIFIRVYILYYFNHGRGTAKYRESVCLSVCLSVCERISKTSSQNVAKVSVCGPATSLSFKPCFNK